MRIRLILFLILVLSFTSIHAQRQLTKIAEPFRLTGSVVANDDIIYLAGDSSFYSYDGTSLISYNYPFRGASQLRYSSGLTKLGDNLYMILNAGGERFLYRFSGGSFRAVPVPGEIKSDHVIYHNEIYIISRITSGSPMKLFRYDGARLNEVPAVRLPEFGDVSLKAAGPYLYVTVREDSLIRYDGTTTRTLPYFNLFGNVRDVHTLSGTNDTYLQVWNDKIWYYNESIVTPVYDRYSVYTNFIEWRGKLWFYATWLPEEEGHLYSIQGDELQAINLPAGETFIPRSNIAVFNDTLYVPAKSASGTTVIYKYNGTTFAKFLDLAEPPAQTILHPRIDDLLIHPDFRNSNSAYYYDGTNVASIAAPSGKVLYQYHAGTPCFHIWSAAPDPSSPATTIGTLAVERAECSANTIIPEGLRGYDRIDLLMNGRNRNWCWSEIIIDWVINPVCPNPQTCPDPIVVLSLTDKAGDIVWTQSHGKPFKASLLKLEDLPYMLSIANEQKEPFFLFSPELVKKGIEEINIEIDPSKEKFFLSIKGEKSNIPISICLLNKEHKIIWQEKIFVPYQKEIVANVDEPGSVIYISGMEGLSMYKKVKKDKKPKKDKNKSSQN